ncbi:hypothetical protein SLEP1_g11018 [Rubroshorea leprosula]|uniref:Uncharacterized protein n=1 Tax=Rubroshorea leprosula TaxID=152421 RepID=A0AAV5IJ81_9ROSI|nr:hypothetical protein SLEP1_g11018 [Rubroshorea leprosula]
MAPSLKFFLLTFLVVLLFSNNFSITTARLVSNRMLSANGLGDAVGGLVGEVGSAVGSAVGGVAGVVGSVAGVVGSVAGDVGTVIPGFGNSIGSPPGSN